MFIQYIFLVVAFTALVAVLAGVFYLIDSAVRDGERDGIVLRDR